MLLCQKQKKKERKKINFREENGERKKKESGGDPDARCCAMVELFGRWRHLVGSVEGGAQQKPPQSVLGATPDGGHHCVAMLTFE